MCIYPRYIKPVNHTPSQFLRHSVKLQMALSPVNMCLLVLCQKIVKLLTISVSIVTNGPNHMAIMWLQCIQNKTWWQNWNFLKLIFFFYKSSLWIKKPFSRLIGVYLLHNGRKFEGPTFKTLWYRAQRV